MTYLAKKPCSSCSQKPVMQSLGGLFDTITDGFSNILGAATGGLEANKANPNTAAVTYLSNRNPFAAIAIHQSGAIETTSFDTEGDATVWLQANNADPDILYAAYMGTGGHIVSGGVKHGEVIEVTGAAPKKASRMPLLLGLGALGYWLSKKRRKGAR